MTAHPPHPFVARALPGGVCQLHRAGCRAVVGKHAPGYLLGDGLTAAQLRAELVRRGDYRERTRFCKVCLPELEPLPAWQAPGCWAPGCGRPMSDVVHVLDHCFVGERHGRLLGYRPPGEVLTNDPTEGVPPCPPPASTKPATPASGGTQMSDQSPRYCLSVDTEPASQTVSYYSDDPAAMRTAWDLLERYARAEVVATLEARETPNGTGRVAVLGFHSADYVLGHDEARPHVELTRTSPPALPTSET